MGTVSCIVSAYYAEEFLAGRLQNLIEQSTQPEIIVVCRRGSKEYSIASAWENSKSLIRVIETDDIPTIYAAWNLGIQAATGDYITNQNSDDRLYPGALAKLVDALDKHAKKYNVVYSNADIVETLGGPPAGRYEWMEGGIEELLHGCFLGPWPMWRKSLHEKYGYFDGEMYSAGDYEFWMRLAKAGEKFFHLREVNGAYLKRDNSAEHRHKLRSIWEQARAKGRYREGVTELWTKPEPMTG